jgi:hypothetical protein
VTARRALQRAALYTFHVVVVRPVLRILVGATAGGRSFRRPLVSWWRTETLTRRPVLPPSRSPVFRIVHPVAAAGLLARLLRARCAVLMNAIPIQV